MFCPQRANSKEDLWPKWIVERAPKGIGTFGVRGLHERIYIPGPGTIKARVVCRRCNNEWMSRLESSAIPIMGSLMKGLNLELGVAEQATMARWSIKTAMTFEAQRPTRQRRFYTDEERRALRSNGIIPRYTVVWTARYGGRLSANAEAYDVGGLDERNILVPGYVTTLAIGNLALQVVTLRYGGGSIHSEQKPGPWDASTLQIWPYVGVQRWPPRLSLYDEGALTIDQFDRRWAFGPPHDGWT